jgi:hypothetical protein
MPKLKGKVHFHNWRSLRVSPGLKALPSKYCNTGLKGPFVHRNLAYTNYENVVQDCKKIFKKDRNRNIPVEESLVLNLFLALCVLCDLCGEFV